MNHTRLFISRFLLTGLTALCALGIYTPSIMPQQGPQIQLPGQMPSNQDPFALPSDEEMEAMIASMPPEMQGEMRKGFAELKAMPEQERQKVMQEAQQQMESFVNTMSPEELQELERLSKLTPEELEEEFKKMLLESGIDPETGNPLNNSDAYVPQESPSLPEPEKKPAQEVKVEDRDSTQAMLKRLAKGLDSLQLILNLHPQQSGSLSSLTQEIADLTYFVKTLNEKSKLVSLIHDKNKDLVKSLSHIEKIITAQQGKLQFTEPQETTTPYTILGVSSNATEDEIENAYEKLSQKKNIQKIKDDLTEQGASEKEIKKALREAELTHQIIEDAYETLSDDKLKAQLDRELRAKSANDSSLSKETKNALSKIGQAFSSAIYEHDLINKLESFLEDHAPQALAEKKKLEDEEKRRKDEQRSASLQRPSITPGNFEPTYHVGSSSYNPLGNNNYYSPTYSSANYGAYDPYNQYPSYNEGQPPKDKSGSNNQEKPLSIDDKQRKEKEEPKDKKNTSNQDKKSFFAVTELKKDIDSLLKNFEKASFIQALPAYLEKKAEIEECATQLTTLYKKSRFETILKRIDEVHKLSLQPSEQLAAEWRGISDQIPNLLALDTFLHSIKETSLTKERLVLIAGTEKQPGLQALTKNIKTITEKLASLNEKIMGEKSIEEPSFLPTKKQNPTHKNPALPHKALTTNKKSIQQNIYTNFENNVNSFTGNDTFKNEIAKFKEYLKTGNSDQTITLEETIKALTTINKQALELQKQPLPDEFKLKIQQQLKQLIQILTLPQDILATTHQSTIQLFNTVINTVSQLQ